MLFVGSANQPFDKNHRTEMQRCNLFISKVRFITGLLFIFLLPIVACRHAPTIPTSPVLTYNQDVTTIILNNCATAGCHDGGGRGGKRRLVSYTDVMQYVSAGKPFDSKLYNSITNLSFNRMPPQGKMANEQIKVIYIWILQGAKEN
jgi:hypothetical protein